MKKDIEVHNSKLIIKEVVREEITRDEFGRPVNKVYVKESVSEYPVNLGSVKKPNQKIISYKYVMPRKKKSILGALFQEDDD